MAEQKPPQQSWESWIEEQIQQARADGAFDQLPGKGKPIPDLLEPYDPLWWIKKLLEREKLSVLPPALEVRAKADRALEAVWGLAREEDVRARVRAINGEIARANRTTADGPPTSLAPLDADEVVARWRAGRPTS